MRDAPGQGVTDAGGASPYADWDGVGTPVARHANPLATMQSLAALQNLPSPSRSLHSTSSFESAGSLGSRSHSPKGASGPPPRIAAPPKGNSRKPPTPTPVAAVVEKEEEGHKTEEKEKEDKDREPNHKKKRPSGIPVPQHPIPSSGNVSVRSPRASPDGTQGLASRHGSHSRVHAVQVTHTGQHRELPDSCTSRKASSAGASSSGVQVTVQRHSRYAKCPRDDDEVHESSDPTSVLSPPAGTVAIDGTQGEGTQRTPGGHKPRTHSIQSLFRRKPVATHTVVKHVPGRHRTTGGTEEPPSQRDENNNFHSPTHNHSHNQPVHAFPNSPTLVLEPLGPQFAPGGAVPIQKQEFVPVTKTLALSGGGEKIGVKWQGDESGELIRVADVNPGSAAARAGITAGMYLVSIDGVRIPGRAALEGAVGPQGTAMEKLKAGESISFDLLAKREAPSSGDDDSSSYDVEYRFDILQYHPIFEAVWLPCITAMIAHTCFLQLPLIIGSIGIMWTLVVLLVTAVISYLSLASIAALLRRKTLSSHDNETCDPYKIVSRHVGTEYGGAVGVLYWLVLVMLCSLHAQGLGEAGYWYWGIDQFGFSYTLSVSMVAWLVQIGVTVCISRGVKYVSFIELLAVILTVLAIIIAVLGLSQDEPSEWKTGSPSFSTLGDNWLEPDTKGSDALTITAAFCRFFPSSLGILVVVGRATDMQKPEKDLGKATFKAITVCWIVFIAVILLLGASFAPLGGEREVEGNETAIRSAEASLQVFPEVAFSRVLFMVIVMIAVLVQCVQSLIIAPYILSAIARDHIAPFLDYFQTEESEHPFKALILSAIIAASLVPAGGHLYTGVTIVSLVCLLLLNGVAAFTTFMQAAGHYNNAGYSWGFTTAISLMGFILSVYALFAIGWSVALTALLISLGTAKYLEIRSDFRSWGEGVKGLQLQHALEKLLSLESTREQTKNWRPQLLVLLRLDQHGRIQDPRLLSVADQLKAGKGLVIFSAVIEGDAISRRHNVLEAKRTIKGQMESIGMHAFCKVIAAPSYLEGHSMMLQCLGLGSLSPNTVLTAWPNDWKTRIGAALEFTSLLAMAHEMGKAALVIRGVNHFPCSGDELNDVVNAPISGEHVDLWWIVHDGGIELLLAFLLRQHAVWKKCELRIFTIVPAEEEIDKLVDVLSQELARLRIDAILIVHPVEGEWIREFTCNQDEEAEIKNRAMDTLCMTEEERAHEVDHVMMSRRHRISTPAPGISPDADADGMHRVSRPSNAYAPGPTPQSAMAPSPAMPRCNSLNATGSNFESFPMVELVGSGSRRSNLTGHMTSVVYHFECLNELIREHSCPTDLVVISLPDSSNFYTPEEFMDCMDTMLSGIARAILIRGTGEQIITGYW